MQRHAAIAKLSLLAGLTHPALLCPCPTSASGLDSFTAYSVTYLLRNVAHQHKRTIVATIHQPSSEIFHLSEHTQTDSRSAL